jgi:5-methylcytosine-specific restriction protein B
VDGGRTEYRNGVLLQLLDALQKDPEEMHRVPFVLILDEMNRADLSKVLGECFSLLEDREMPVQLAGQDEIPFKVAIPPHLFVIGTMNLIDQSLEQVDFALRRRFLWFMRGFDADQFLQIARLRWEKSITRDWNRHEPEFALLSERAQTLNRQITDHPALGQQYEIGHTYFCDVISFIVEDLAAVRGRQKLLFSKTGHARDETVGRLWRYSLEPLIQQYLSGTDVAETRLFIDRVKTVLLKGNTL